MVRVEHTIFAADELASLLDWWRGAGVDSLVDDAARDWLKPPEPIAARLAAIPNEPTAHAPVPAAPVAQHLPETLDALLAWLAVDAALPLAGPAQRRIAPSGSHAAELMIVTGQPEIGDAEAGQLIAGPAGRLFDRMLAAIGLDRATVWLAPLSGSRAPGGRIDADALSALTRIMIHHIGLAKPRRLLIVGDEASRALLGTAVAGARGRKHALNHNSGTVPAVATFHPRFLIQQPARKAEAWKDLRLLIGEQN